MCEGLGEPWTASAELITDDATLDARIAALGATVGVDTEFMRVRTFHPIPALYQLAGTGADDASPADVALVDAQAKASFTGLAALLLDAERTKVMHSCAEDLEVIAGHLGVRPVNVADTQVAHALLTTDFSASYAAVVDHYLGVKLSKHETRSDWLQRPLSPRQLAYAREDAAYLPLVWREQCAELHRLGRLSWFHEEMRRRLETDAATPDTWYRTLKGIARFTSRELAVLRGLVSWREREARRRNLPRAWVVKDEWLLAMARRKELAAADIGCLLPKRSAARYASALVRMHGQGLRDPDPPERAPRPLNRQEGTIVKALRERVRVAAERLTIAPELLARRRDLEEAYRHFRQHGELPERFHGWRDHVVGDALRRHLLAAVS